MQVWIGEDELYPLFQEVEPTTFRAVPIRVNGRVLKRWREAESAFRRVQREMRAAVDAVAEEINQAEKG
jgi:hypothetical protein